MAIPPYKKDLEDFLQDTLFRNTWLVYSKIKIYVRQTNRLLDNERRATLDIGSVEVAEEHQQKGVFTQWLGLAERTAKKANRAVYVENVLNGDLARFLAKRGYKKVDPNESTPSFYKII